MGSHFWSKLLLANGAVALLFLATGRHYVRIKHRTLSFYPDETPETVSARHHVWIINYTRGKPRPDATKLLDEAEESVHALCGDCYAREEICQRKN